MATIIDVKVESKIQISLNGHVEELSYNAAKALCEMLMDRLGINSPPIQYTPIYTQPVYTYPSIVTTPIITCNTESYPGYVETK